MNNASVNLVLDSNLRLLTEHLGRICKLLEMQPLQLELHGQLLELHKRAKLAERRLRIRFSRGLLSLEPVSDASAVEGRPAAPLPGVDPDSPALRPCVEAARALENFFRSFGLAEEAEIYRKLRFDLSALAKEQESLGRSGSGAPAGRGPAASLTSASRRVSAALVSCPLYFILDESLCENRDPLRVAMDALAGGVQIMQLRFKQLSSARLLDLARRLKPLCAERGCILIINDRLDIALLAEADGLHIGDDDPPLPDIRSLAPQLLVGVTARKPQNALRAQEQGADYVACGALFGSPTKPAVTVVGLRTLQQVVTAVQIPVVGIGGVTLDNCHSVLESGALGFCSISPFLNTRKPLRSLVQDFLRRATYGDARSAGTVHETVDTL